MDKDEERVAALEEGRAPIYEPGLDELVAGAVMVPSGMPSRRRQWSA